MVFFSEAGQPYEGPTHIQTCGLYYRGLACQAKITGELVDAIFGPNATQPNVQSSLVPWYPSLN